jgi:hypothetical protein
MSQHQVETQGNDPSIFEVDHVSSFFKRRLDELESLNLRRVSESELTRSLEQALSMKQALTDLASEDGGYYLKLPRLLNSALSVDVRISQFVAKARATLGREYELSHLAPYEIEQYRADASKGFSRFEFEEYLEYLESNATSLDLPLPEVQATHWKRYAEVCSRLLNYLQFLVSGRVTKGGHNEERPASFVFLLRDTLLVYLGMKRLCRAGWPVEARALLVGRALLQSFAPTAPRNHLYASLFNLLYESLANHTGRFDSDFLATYKRTLSLHATSASTALLVFLERYCSTVLAQDRKFIIVENGVHGTMPLLVMASTPAVTDLRMYTAIPWLQDFYMAVIFSDLSVHMRDLESVHCQEQLFQFAGVTGDRILVKETRDWAVRRISYQEIRYFLDAVDQRFLSARTGSNFHEAPTTES